MEDVRRGIALIEDEGGASSVPRSTLRGYVKHHNADPESLSSLDRPGRPQTMSPHVEERLKEYALQMKRIGRGVGFADVQEKARAIYQGLTNACAGTSFAL